MKTPDVKELVLAARSAATKMKLEYDCQENIVAANECWQEQERLVAALQDFDEIYPQ